MALAVCTAQLTALAWYAAFASGLQRHLDAECIHSFIHSGMMNGSCRAAEGADAWMVSKSHARTGPQTTQVLVRTDGGSNADSMGGPPPPDSVPRAAPRPARRGSSRLQPAATAPASDPLATSPRRKRSRCMLLAWCLPMCAFAPVNRQPEAAARAQMRLQNAGSRPAGLPCCVLWVLCCAPPDGPPLQRSGASGMQARA